MQMPLPSLVPTVLKIASWLSGADLNRVSPLELLKRTQLPVLVIHGSLDPVVSQADMQAIEQIMNDRLTSGIPTSYCKVEGAAHVMALVGHPDEYRQRIGEFLAALESTTSPRQQEQLPRIGD
jgi:pimeloyl-ACP methyl ester carboxylesterase